MILIQIYLKIIIHTSLAILDVNNKLIYNSSSDSINKAYIVKINEDRYTPIKPTTSILIKIKQLKDYLKRN